MQIINLFVVENYIWQIFLDKLVLQAQWGNSVGSHRVGEEGIYPPSMTLLTSVG